MLFQGGDSLQGRPEPLSHLPKVRGEGGRNRDGTGPGLEAPGLGLPLLGVRQRPGPAKRQISEREPNRRTWKIGQ